MRRLRRAGPEALTRPATLLGISVVALVTTAASAVAGGTSPVPAPEADVTTPAPPAPTVPAILLATTVPPSTTLPDTDPPPLELDPAIDGSRTTSGRLTVRGTSEPGVNVQVASVVVAVGADGTWAAEIDLQAGDNDIPVVAVDAAGNLTERRIRVGYDVPRGVIPPPTTRPAPRPRPPVPPPPPSDDDLPASQPPATSATPVPPVGVTPTTGPSASLTSPPPLPSTTTRVTTAPTTAAPTTPTTSPPATTPTTSPPATTPTTSPPTTPPPPTTEPPPTTGAPPTTDPEP